MATASGNVVDGSPLLGGLIDGPNRPPLPFGEVRIYPNMEICDPRLPAGISTTGGPQIYKEPFLQLPPPPLPTPEQIFVLEHTPHVSAVGANSPPPDFVPMAKRVLELAKTVKDFVDAAGGGAADAETEAAEREREAQLDYEVAQNQRTALALGELESKLEDDSEDDKDPNEPSADGDGL